MEEGVVGADNRSPQYFSSIILGPLGEPERKYPDMQKRLFLVGAQRAPLSVKNNPQLKRPHISQRQLECLPRGP